LIVSAAAGEHHVLIIRLMHPNMSFMKNLTVPWPRGLRLACFALLTVGALHSVSFAQRPTKPTLYLIGDSTVRNGSGKGADSMWGWGSLLVDAF
jgi:hypothetical protein